MIEQGKRVGTFPAPPTPLILPPRPAARAGDLVGFPSLACTSMEQGLIGARVTVGAIAREPPKSFPYGIYAVPEITTCGLTEEEVKERKIPMNAVSPACAKPREVTSWAPIPGS